MTADLPAQSIAAIVTILAALITSSLSFVSLTLNKEQKTSEFRQAWIDGLRQDLATFFASARSFTRASEERRAVASGAHLEASLALSPEQVSDARYQAAETRYRIQLRLNPEEPQHVELLRRIQLAIDEINALAATGDTTNTLRAIDDAANFAPQILKAEWERVKGGEFAFRVARNWLAPGIVILSLVVVSLVWTGKIRL